MTELVSLHRQDRFAVLRITHPPLNTLSRAVLRRLRERLLEACAQPGVEAIVVCGDGRGFSAGADVREFSEPGHEAESFDALLRTVEDCALPVVAALHGPALGGGLELAMSCHARVALPRSRLGLPEVLLGLLPGAGGTQRLPRLAGVAAALDLIGSGRSLDAEQALAAGIVDAVDRGAADAEAAGIAHAHALLEGRAPRRRTRDLRPDTAALPPGFFAQAAASAAAQAAAGPARGHIVRCVEAACGPDFDAGLRLERSLFLECLASPQSQALRHVFFAQREAARIPGLPAGLALRPVHKVGVVGAGTMGGGIAMNFANAGIPTVLVEARAEALERGLGVVRRNYEASAAKGRLTAREVEARMGLLQGSLELERLADCDLVIEAVFENLEVKRELMARLGAVCKPGAIIATNTSTLDVDALARASGRPADVLGLHFFSPANVMKLLEIVRGAATDAAVLATALDVARRIGKLPVVSGVCYGFIGNRMLESYLREADFLLMEGATPQQIDRAIEAQGLSMGPLRMLDLAGTDVSARVVEEGLKAGVLPAADPAYRAPNLALYAAGRFGQKTGAGYYRYEGRTPVPDPAVEALCRDLARRHGIARREDIGDAEIVERCLYSLINEGARILQEGIAYRPGDIDVVWVAGYGFADWRGGPLWLADRIGLPAIVAALEAHGRRRGPDAHGYWSVAPLLAERAAAGQPLSAPLSSSSPSSSSLSTGASA